MRGQVAPGRLPAVFGVSNFTALTLDLPARSVVVLINLHHPIVAFAEEGAGDGGQITFIDAFDLARQFREGGGYLVLTAREARSPIGAEAYRLLAQAELDQLRYWRPQSLGEVVFNHWD